MAADRIGAEEIAEGDDVGDDLVGAGQRGVENGGGVPQPVEGAGDVLVPTGAVSAANCAAS